MAEEEDKPAEKIFTGIDPLEPVRDPYRAGIKEKLKRLNAEVSITTMNCDCKHCDPWMMTDDSFSAQNQIRGFNPDSTTHSSGEPVIECDPSLPDTTSEEEGEDSQGFGRIHESLGEDLQGFVNLWERVCKDLRDFGRGFSRIQKTLGEDLQGIARLWERICKDS